MKRPRRCRWLLGSVVLASIGGLASCAPPSANPRQIAAPARGLLVDTLPGWDTDQIASALPVLQQSCARLALTPPDQKLGGAGEIAARAGQAGQWSAICKLARAVPPGEEEAARDFLRAHFDVIPLTGPGQKQGLFTGYYEPEIAGSRERTRVYHVPLLTKPADLTDQIDANRIRHIGRMQDGVLVPYYTRAEIDAGALKRQRLDLLYLKSPIDLFFLQIQGAGRIDLPNGHVVRVGYAAGNGQPYVPIGRVLSERGDLPPDQVSAGSIRAWLVAHPRQARATMEQNTAYTFFRELPDLSADSGPPGTLGVPLTPLRSIAVDPHFVPLGAPVWIDTVDADGGKLQRLMLAQDTGSGVAGTVRADIFYGWGAAAESQASRMQAPGRCWLLLPKTPPMS